MMKRRLFVGVMILCLVLLFSAMGSDLAQAQRKFVTLASGWVVGVYYPLAGAMSRIVYEKVPGVRMTVESSGASVANAKLIGSGDADFAILQNDIAYYALNGIKPIFDAPIKNIRGVACLYPEHVQIQARRDAKIMSVKDLKGKRVAVGPLGSGTEANARQILEVYGLTFEDLGRVERLTAAESGDFLKDNRIDAAFYTTGVGASGIVDTALVADMVIVPISGPEADNLIKKYPYYAKAKVPAGIYKGTDKNVDTVAVLATLVAKSELEESIVYNITKAIFENLETLERAHAKGKEVKLETALVGMPIPLHPGAEKFFKEKGMK